MLVVVLEEAGQFTVYRAWYFLHRKHSKMQTVILLLVLGGSICCSARNYVSLEHDQDLYYWKEKGWEMMQRVEPSKQLTLTFALKQRNIGKLQNILFDVSDPESSTYCRYITVKQITKIISPSRRTLNVVKRWLAKQAVTDCEVTQNKDFLVCQARRDTAENLLVGAVFYYFKHPNADKLEIRSPSRYYVPGFVAKHLDFVGGLHRFPPVSQRKQTDSKDNSSKAKHRSQPDIHVGVYPAVLRERYNISNNVGSHPDNSQAVAQFLGQFYNAADLKEFMYIFGSGFVHLTEIAKVIGPDTGRSGIEASLDTQYIMSTGANITTWFWSTAGRHESQEPFLTWLIAVGNTSKVPHVHSVSYGEAESTLSVSYMRRVNVEFMKAGARGLSILFASGDDGAGCKKEKFAPNFPATSPYVTSVGGTALSNPFTTSGEYGYEISSGGFSNLFGQPTYQYKHVKNYLTKSPNLPAEKYFNRSGRAYPDIASISNHFWIVNNRIPVPGVAGTSAAAPTVSGIISLLNDARLNRNLPVMGFLNPFLYKNSAALYDVTSGCNEGCLSGDKGFCAFQGWDPVTGNGSPNFAALVKVAIKMFEGPGTGSRGFA